MLQQRGAALGAKGKIRRTGPGQRQLQKPASLSLTSSKFLFLSVILTSENMQRQNKCRFYSLSGLSMADNGSSFTPIECGIKNCVGLSQK